MFVIQDSFGNYLTQISTDQNGTIYQYNPDPTKALQFPGSTANAFISDTKNFPNCEAIKADELELTEVQQLAIFLHSFCSSSHTDQCSWGYEFNEKKHDWNGSTHKDYLKKAQNLRDTLTGSLLQIKAMVRVIRKSL